MFSVCILHEKEKNSRQMSGNRKSVTLVFFTDQDVLKYVRKVKYEMQLATVFHLFDRRAKFEVLYCYYLGSIPG